jgi:hypothetical protein
MSKPTKESMKHKFYKWIWRERLKEDKVLKVKGWRSFIVVNAGGNQQTIACCKWWLQ